MAGQNTQKAMEPYDWGLKAALVGMSEDSNPYWPGTDEHSDWLAGFEDLRRLDTVAMISRKRLA
ncbi:MAG: hypothetical protein ABWY13_06215 [Mesorhizobium sp.]